MFENVGKYWNILEMCENVGKHWKMFDDFGKV